LPIIICATKTAGLLILNGSQSKTDTDCPKNSLLLFELP
jgi:hypothetical protein